MEHVIELINDFPIKKNIHQTFIDFRDKNDNSYKIQFYNANNVYQITAFDKCEHTIHLINIIKKEQLNDINNIYDLLVFLQTNLNNVKQYCVICQTKLNWQSEDLLACENHECQILYEESLFGNYVVPNYNLDTDIFMFHITSAIDAIKYKNMEIRFEPFPQFCINGTTIYKRNILDNLTDSTYKHNKNFTKIKSLADNINIDNIISTCKYCDTDLDLRNIIGDDTYRLLRFIILTLNVKITLDENLMSKHTGLDNVKIYRIDQQSYKNEEYNNIKPNNPTIMLFHGSQWFNWFSILRNGLVNCSKTPLMSTGAVYGNGIYLSDNAEVSCNYGNGFIGVFEVIGTKEQYHKANNVFVCDNDKYIIQRYLIKMSQKNANIINSIFLINGETTGTPLRVTQKCAQRLVREFVKLKNNNIGYTINVNKNDLTLWNLSLNQFDEQYNICKDMIKHNINEIVLGMRFNGDYPMSPPFIRIIRPRIQPLTGHITSHGVICMELLTKSGWSPACSIETLLVIIKSEIIEGDGRLDMTNTNDYDYNDAKQSFVNMCKIHKWEN